MASNMRRLLSQMYWAHWYGHWQPRQRLKTMSVMEIWQMRLAQHWCGMVQRHAEGKLEDLPLELQHDALMSAAALAPDVKVREFLLHRYAERRHKLELKKPTPG
jgi:hypothetical protein